MSIIPLISSWEQYILSHPTGDLRDFGRWLQTSSLSRPTAQPADAPPLPQPADASASHAPAEPDPVLLARHSLATDANLDASAASALLVNRLNTINHFLSKPVIRKLGFTKDAEFGVLVQVHLMDRPNKKELCRQLLIENSTGVEITRRLAKKGYLRETIDPNDRRSSRLSLTDKGQRLLKEGYAGSQSIYKGFLAPLLPDQQQQFVAILTRLYDHHSARIDHLIDRLKDRT
jgi:DNA-binding MarR family transcriptional regulator